MTQQVMVEQQAALMDFLDDLLSEEPETGALPEEPAPQGDSPSDTPLAQANGVFPEFETTVVKSPAAWSPDGRIPIIPDWAGQTFQAMVFKVGELSLAIPLTELAGVLEWRPELLDTGLATGVCLGRYPHAGQSVSVIDTARFIFPEQQLPFLSTPDSNRRLTRMILINKGKIGLVCHTVFELIDIDPQQVSWRSDKTRRQWLAGTMLAQLIAILDARTTAEILAAYSTS